MRNESAAEFGVRTIYVETSRIAMGRKAAHDIASELRRRLSRQSDVRVAFAAAPSQNEMLDALVHEPTIDWSRVTAFHLDVYLGLDPSAPQRFSLWLRRMLFDRLPFAAVHLIEPHGDVERVASNYALALSEKPIDIVCLGIGTNGHLAFNDPPADFDDLSAVKVVQLDDVCRQQQVDDGCFARFEDVPTRALTLTIPRLLAADRLFCCVPGLMKREAVRRTLMDPVNPACPSTALRTHPDCTLYLDRESAGEEALAFLPRWGDKSD
jgi:glucosamine-6-phosphate deaminase